MITLEDNEAEAILTELERFNDGAVGVPGHPVAAIIEKLRTKLDAAKRSSTRPTSAVAVRQHTAKPDRTSKLRNQKLGDSR